MVIMVLIGVCTAAIYLHVVHQYVTSSTRYAPGAYDEELLDASSARAVIILLMSLCPLVFGGAAVWLARNSGVMTLGARLRRIKGWHWAVGVAATILVWFSIINGGLPRIEDDLGYIFQARLFFHGMRSLPTEALGSSKNAFFWWWTTGGSHLYSFQIPGHSLMLSLGAFGNSYSLVCVIQAAVTCLATYRAATLLYGRRVAALAGLLFATSPFVIMTFSSYCASCSVAFWAAITIWVWAAFRRNPSMVLSILVGAGLGITLWMRPTSSLFIGIPIVIDLLVRVGKKDARWYYLGPMVFFFGALCAGHVYYCSSLTGHLSLSPGDVYSERLVSDEMSLGNLLNRPHDQIVNIPGFIYSLAVLNFYLHGWPISLFFMTIYLAVHRKTRTDWVLAASCILMFSFYAVWRERLTWYYFELIPALVLLSSQSVTGLYDQCRAKWGENHRISRTVMTLVGAGVFTSVCFAIPLTMAKEYIRRENYNWVDKAVRRTIKTPKALVLLGKTVAPPLDKHLLSRNHPFFEGDIVYMSSRGEPGTPREVPSFLRDRAIHRLEMTPHYRTIMLSESCQDQ
jgi:hypothetical protein